MNIKLTEYPVTHICTLCGTEYIRGGYGYCDESLECAMDSGEHLVQVQHRQNCKKLKQKVGTKMYKQIIHKMENGADRYAIISHIKTDCSCSPKRVVSYSNVGKLNASVIVTFVHNAN